MSYILEALKKSEQERHLGDVPRLDSAQVSGRADASRPLWPWLVGGVLLVNAGVMLWLAVKPAAQHPSVAAVSGENDSSAPVPPASVQPSQETPSSAQPPNPVQNSSTQVQAGNPTAAVRPAGEPGSSTPQVQAALEPPAAGGVKTLPAADYSDVPRWEALTAQQKSRLVLPTLDVHVYADQPERRFVLIDLQKYREGERLDNGARIAAITPEGVVMEYQGMRYRVERP